MASDLAKTGRMIAFAISSLYVLLGVPVVNAQYSETTGSIQGIAKDPSGAVVSGATLEVTSPAMVGVRTRQTDSDGFYRFLNLPPGKYALAVTAAGFRPQKRIGIELEVGRQLSIDIALEIGPVRQTLIVKSAPLLIDTLSSTAEVNVTADEIERLPKDRSAYSLINLAPGARAEKLQGASFSLQGAYQIDGASDSENVYAVEGMDSSDVLVGGLLSPNGVDVSPRYDFMQELQVKSSGISAEYGGALGGVANVVEKSGGSAWHGAGLLYCATDALQGAPRPELRPNFTIPPQPAKRLGFPTEYYYPKSDKWTRAEPGFELGGYLRKDRLWVYTSYIPSLYRQARTVNFNFQPPTPQAPVLGTRTFHSTDSTNYALGRLDWTVTSKIRTTLSWHYSFDGSGGTDIPGPDSRKFDPANPNNQFNTDSTVDPASFLQRVGGASPNSSYTFSADWTVTPKLVVSGRFGYSYSNSKFFGYPVGIQYYYATPTTGVTGLDGSPLPASVPQGPAGFSYLVNNGQPVPNFAVFSRHGLNLDADYMFRAGGLHAVKVGYAFNRLANNQYQVGNGALVIVGWGQDYGPSLSTGQGEAFCAQNSQQNLARYGQAVCQGNYGTYIVEDGSEVGDVSSFNHSLYLQDSWQVAQRLTLNLGIRLDKEYLPSYQQFPGNPHASQPIKFGFLDKVAPRFGAAWDVLGNRRLKVYGSWGVYYDIMKYWVALASFGALYGRDCIFTLDTTDLSTINPIRGATRHDCPSAGGTPGREIEEVNFAPSLNDPNNNHIVPNMKPMRQHELVLGGEYALRPDLGLEVRYARKRLDHTIEDVGIYTPQGPDTLIGNPGEGGLTNVVSSVCPSCPNQPKAIRNYDGLELRLNKRWGGQWFGTASYTYSRLWGNYSGLTDSDEFGRHAPNLTIAFDQPDWTFDSHGSSAIGPLATDRPNTLKLYGARDLKWRGMKSTMGITQLAYSGIPITTLAQVAGGRTFVEGRGNFANVTRDPETGNLVLNGISHGVRTPAFTNTDFLFIHEFKVSKSNEAMRASFEVNVSNLWNQYQLLFVSGSLTGLVFRNPDPSLAENGVPDWKTVLTGYDYIKVANAERRSLNSSYGLPFRFEAPRSIRLKLKFSF